MAARELGLGFARSCLRPCGSTLTLSSKSASVTASLVRRSVRSIRSLSTSSANASLSKPSAVPSLRIPASFPASHASPSSVLRSLRYNSTSSKTADIKSTPEIPTAKPDSNLVNTPPSPSTLVTALPSDVALPTSTSGTPDPKDATTKKDKKKEETPDVASIMRMLEFAKPQWRLISIGVFCLCISTGVNLGIPWVIGRIIDFFAPGSEQTLLFGLPVEYATAALAVVLLIGAAANSGRSVALRLSGQRTAALIRNRTYGKYLSLPPSHIETAGVGDALSRLGQDTSIVGQSLSENLGEGLKAILGAAAGIGAMWLISPTLTLVMLFVIPPISIGSFFYGRFIRTLSLKTQEAMGGMSKLAEERLSAHRTVTASNTQPAERGLFAGKVDSVYQLQKKETFANGVFQGGNEVAGDFAMIGLLLYGGVLVKRGEISVGDMTALFIYVNWIEWSLNSEL